MRLPRNVCEFLSDPYLQFSATWWQHTVKWRHQILMLLNFCLRREIDENKSNFNS